MGFQLLFHEFSFY